MLKLLAPLLAALLLAGCTVSASGHRHAHGAHSWHYHDHRSTAWDQRSHWRKDSRSRHDHRRHGPRRGQQRHGWWR